MLNVTRSTRVPSSGLSAAQSIAADPGEPQPPRCLAGPRFTGGASSIPPTAQRSPRRVPAAAAAKAAMSKSFPGLPQGCDAGAKSNKGCSITSCLRHVGGSRHPAPAPRQCGLLLLISASLGLGVNSCWKVTALSFPRWLHWKLFVSSRRWGTQGGQKPADLCGSSRCPGAQRSPLPVEALRDRERFPEAQPCACCSVPGDVGLQPKCHCGATTPGRSEAGSSRGVVQRAVGGGLLECTPECLLCSSVPTGIMGTRCDRLRAGNYPSSGISGCLPWLLGFAISVVVPAVCSGVGQVPSFVLAGVGASPVPAGFSPASSGWSPQHWVQSRAAGAEDDAIITAPCWKTLLLPMESSQLRLNLTSLKTKFYVSCKSLRLDLHPQPAHCPGKRGAGASPGCAPSFAAVISESSCRAVPECKIVVWSAQRWSGAKEGVGDTSHLKHHGSIPSCCPLQFEACCGHSGGNSSFVRAPCERLLRREVTSHSPAWRRYEVNRGAHKCRVGLCDVRTSTRTPLGLVFAGSPLLRLETSAIAVCPSQSCGDAPGGSLPCSFGWQRSCLQGEELMSILMEIYIAGAEHPKSPRLPRRLCCQHGGALEPASAPRGSASELRPKEMFTDHLQVLGGAQKQPSTVAELSATCEKIVRCICGFWDALGLQPHQTLGVSIFSLGLLSPEMDTNEHFGNAAIRMPQTSRGGFQRQRRWAGIWQKVLSLLFGAAGNKTSPFWGLKMKWEEVSVCTACGCCAEPTWPGPLLPAPPAQHRLLWQLLISFCFGAGLQRPEKCFKVSKRTGPRSTLMAFSK
ncbi:hypothetical protein Anapl_10955 [Anas platyrhynchos]|uniref:Uncharacterized protein n=1 Tax=Anas platyrhynchos TaxID=8839 RepID=R0JV43_ANAPL|nr:hypothetical protein Anapl_10955 [Anas platyrhynchos]